MNTYTPFYGKIQKYDGPQISIRLSPDELTYDENFYPIVIKKSMNIEMYTGKLWFRIVFSNGVFGCIMLDRDGTSSDFRLEFYDNPNQLFGPIHDNNGKEYRKEFLYFGRYNEKISISQRIKQIGDSHYIHYKRLPDQLIDIIKYYMGDLENNYNIEKLQEYVKMTDKLVEKNEIKDPNLDDFQIKIQFTIKKTTKIPVVVEKFINDKLAELSEHELISKTKEADGVKYVYLLTVNNYNYKDLLDLLETLDVVVNLQELV